MWRRNWPALRFTPGVGRVTPPDTGSPVTTMLAHWEGLIHFLEQTPPAVPPSEGPGCSMWFLFQKRCQQRATWAWAQVKAGKDPGGSRQGPRPPDEGQPTATGGHHRPGARGPRGHSGRTGSGLGPRVPSSTKPCLCPVAAAARHIPHQPAQRTHRPWRVPGPHWGKQGVGRFPAGAPGRAFPGVSGF